MRLVVVPLLVACTSPREPVVLEARDVGRICIYPTDPPRRGQPFVAGAPIFARYESVSPVGAGTLCLSSSCTRDQSAMCSLVQTGTTLNVTTIARWVDLTATAGDCTSDCLVMSAVCSTEPLGAGEYTVAFAAQTLTLPIPSEPAPELCLDLD